MKIRGVQVLDESVGEGPEVGPRDAWFTFFHEAAHLLLHGKKLLFIEGLDGLDSTHEQEADAFARDWLIPPPTAKQLAQMASASSVSKAQVLTFANTLGLAPGIVVGRMQKETWLPWTHLNDLKVRYAWTHLEVASEQDHRSPGKVRSGEP